MLKKISLIFIPFLLLILIFGFSCTTEESKFADESIEAIEEQVEEEAIVEEVIEEQIAEEPIEEEVDEPSEDLIQEPVKVYEDENVIIYFDSLSSEGVVFTVENLTDVNITIQADSISVNKVSINDIMMSDDVAPQSIGKVIAQCRVGSKTPVSTIGGQLRIIDFSDTSFDSYDATFVNVPID